MKVEMFTIAVLVQAFLAAAQLAISFTGPEWLWIIVVVAWTVSFVWFLIEAARWFKCSI